MRLETKKPYNFDRNPKGSTLSKTEQPKTTEKKNEKFLTDQIYMAFGPIKPRAFQLNWTLEIFTHFMNSLVYEINGVETTIFLSYMTC